VTAAGAHIWPARADAETNGESENPRNAGQLGTCGSGYTVNKLRGNGCEEGNWLPIVDAFRTSVACPTPPMGMLIAQVQKFPRLC